MSEFKFACPVCGQHIRCDSTKSGSPMECPTCYRKIVIPQAPTGPDSKLLLSATEVPLRPATKAPFSDESRRGRRASRQATLVGTLSLVVIAGAAAGGIYAFRDKIFKHTSADNTPRSGADADLVKSDTNWTLKLADRKFPEARVAGRINGRDFAMERASVQGGVLSFRQASRTPRELAVMIHLFARRGEDLAGQSIHIDPSRTNAPKVALRWRDDQDQSVTQTLREGYALKIEFGSVAGGFLPGKLYLCTPDDAKSWVAGSFEAEIRKPPAPKPQKNPQPPSPP